MNAPRRSPLIPEVSVIDLNQQGVWKRQLLRHWSNPYNYGGTARDGAPLVWYQYVCRSASGACDVVSVTREQAARIIAADRDPRYEHVRCSTCGETQASGRATCRACGKKIMAGQFALVGYHDFHASGSYTAQRIWLHESEHDCT